MPALGAVAEIEAVGLRQLPSGDLTLDDLVALARLIRDAAARGVDGVVVTQGTDTMEESSFALDLLVDVEAPVVVTGAMRNPTMASPDGPNNLLTAVRVAASPVARGLGCVVVMNDEVHAARFVRKTHTTGVGAFASPATGPLGWVSEGRVRVASRCAPLRRFGSVDGLDVAPVAIVACALGDDGRGLEALLSTGYRGLVVEGFGAGHVPAAMVEVLARAAAAMPVVLTSRTGVGEVLSSTYGFVGSESDLLARGLLSGGALDARKARVALSLAIATTADASAAVRAFEAVRDSLTFAGGPRPPEAAVDPS